MEPTEITAGRLHLRPWQPGDVDGLQRLLDDPEVARWTPHPSPYRTSDAADRIAADAAHWAAGTRAELAVLDATSAELLGTAGLYRLAGTQAEVGWVTSARARGRGIAGEAVGAVCRWGFGALALHRIEARVGVGNWASRRVAEKVGLSVEGTARGGAGDEDLWVFSRLAGEPDRDTSRLPAYPDRTDGVVTVRRWRSSDAPEVARACADPEIGRWLPVPVPYTLEVAHGYVDGTVPTEWFEGMVANCAVTDAVDGGLLGAVGLTVRGTVGEVGYWVAPWARGRAVAGRAARLHADWGFEALGLARVELLADVANHASLRTAEKAGWVREGVARAVRPAPRDPARRVDMVVHARLRTDLAGQAE